MALVGARASHWTDLTRIASEQLVLPAMAEACAKLNPQTPGLREALAFFQEIEERNRQRNRWLLAQLDDANEALSSIGVQAIVMKGGAFLASDRRDAAGWRFFGDLDLLIPQNRLEDAVVALKAIGYLESESAYHPEFHRHYPFLSHPSGVTGIDLHTRAAGLDQTVLLDPQHFFAGAQTITDGSSTVLVPSPTDRMAHLIVNAQILDYRYQRRLFRLRDVLDFHWLVKHYDIDMDDIRGRFEAYRLVRPLLAYLNMMGEVLGPDYEPPADAIGEARWTAATRKVIRQPRRARLYVMRHWLQMFFGQMLNGPQRRHLIQRLLDREQRAEFVARRLSYWQVFKR